MTTRLTPQNPPLEGHSVLPTNAATDIEKQSNEKPNSETLMCPAPAI
jgi:hypothetical protein